MQNEAAWVGRPLRIVPLRTDQGNVAGVRRQLRAVPGEVPNHMNGV